MERETFEATAGFVGKVADQIVQTAYENWPPQLVERVLAPPVHSSLVSVDDLLAMLSSNASYRLWTEGGTPGVPPSLEVPPDGVFFPKIGPVSYKEFPSMTRLELEGAIEMLDVLGTSISDRMALILHAFAASDMPTFLHFFPYRDFEAMIEARLTVVDGAMTRGRWLRPPTDRDHAQQIREQAASLAQDVAPFVGLERFDLDICVGADQPADAVALVDINPILLDTV